VINFTLSAAGLALTSYHLWKHSADSQSPPAYCEQPIELLLGRQQHIDAKLTELMNAAVQCPVESANLIGLGAAEQCLLLFVSLFVISWKILIRRKKNEGLFL
jgi:disulfide bond formation protein DsbB